MTLLEVRKAIGNIMFKSATDKEYRESCLKDGKKVLEKELGQELPKNTTVKFIENKNSDIETNFNGNNLVFVIPEFVGAVVKLDKEHLSQVNGGMDANYDQINFLYFILS